MHPLSTSIYICVPFSQTLHASHDVYVDTAGEGVYSILLYPSLGSQALRASSELVVALTTM